MTIKNELLSLDNIICKYYQMDYTLTRILCVLSINTTERKMKRNMKLKFPNDVA